VSKFLLAKAEAKTGATGSLHNFINSSLAEPWIEDEHVKRRSTHDLQRLCDKRQPGEIPDQGVLALTMGADTQDNGFWYVVRAWGRDLESWLVREGFCPDLETLRTIASESRYQDSRGNLYAVSRVFIDSGGHRTGEIYELARKNPLFVPVKGEIRLSGRPWSVSVLDSIPRRDGKRYPVPGGLQLMRLDVTYYKDLLAGKLNLEPGSPGFFHLHEAVSGDYLAQMTAEYKDEKGHWKCPRHKGNHLWDCEVYCLAAADIQGVRFINRSTNHEQIKQKPQKKRKPSTKWW
jgi:phage terminase large subunit GpA-like protein